MPTNSSCYRPSSRVQAAVRTTSTMSRRTTRMGSDPHTSLMAWHVFPKFREIETDFLRITLLQKLRIARYDLHYYHAYTPHCVPELCAFVIHPVSPPCAVAYYACTIAFRHSRVIAVINPGIRHSQSWAWMRRVVRDTADYPLLSRFGVTQSPHSIGASWEHCSCGTCLMS